MSVSEMLAESQKAPYSLQRINTAFLTRAIKSTALCREQGAIWDVEAVSDSPPSSGDVAVASLAQPVAVPLPQTHRFRGVVTAQQHLQSGQAGEGIHSHSSGTHACTNKHVCMHAPFTHAHTHTYILSHHTIHTHWYNRQDIPHQNPPLKFCLRCSLHLVT